MAKLREAVCVDLFNRNMLIGFREAVRFGLGHLVFLRPLQVHALHLRDDAVQYLLLARKMLVQRSLGKADLLCDIVHRGRKIAALRKQRERSLNDTVFCIPCHVIPPE